MAQGRASLQPQHHADAVVQCVGLALPADLTQTAAAHGRMVSSAEAGDLEGYLQAVRDHYAPLKRALAKAG